MRYLEYSYSTYILTLYRCIYHLCAFMGDLAIVNMETDSDLLPFYNLVCNTSIIRIELETMLGQALHKLLVVQ